VFIGQLFTSAIEDDQHVPLLWPYTAFVISGWLVHFAISRVTRTSDWGLWAALAWGIGLGILNALVRPWLIFYSWYFVVPPALALMLLPWLGDALRWREAAVPIPETRTQPLPQPVTLRNAWPIAITITVTGLLIMLWHLLAPPEPPKLDATYNLGWGVSFYTKLPMPIQIAGFVFIAATVTWAIFAPSPCSPYQAP
jgi:hypothetical protein